MEALRPRHSAKEFAQRGQALYEEKVRPRVTDADKGKFVAIDIETGAYEIDADDFTATERLLQHRPAAQIWLGRVGQRTAYRIGGYPSRRV
ncbi:MAG: hypothetical protein HYX92_11105 [Chloroflexi bacterium]|nr:hypothetical protein [Chloroflexota bacterium]